MGTSSQENSGSQIVVLQTAESAAPENFLKIQTLQPIADFTESKTPGVCFKRGSREL